MSISHAVARANAILASYGTLFNSGTLKVYAGTAPANAGAALSNNTLLGTLTFGSTAFAAASNGSIVANAITRDDSADATGTATFYRSFDSSSAIIEQGSVGATGSGNPLELNSTDIKSGGPIECSSFTVSMT